ncbi:MAG TPA: hypothetical protein VGK31_00940 [Thermoanaerobaculia bacterium]|jgi:hypothetical protein
MNEERFEELYRAAVRFRHASPQLEPLLRHVYNAATKRPTQLGELRNALESLLSFLASEGGRTDANCCTTDALFAVAERDGAWSDLPAGYRHVLDDLGGVLHDTVHAPQIASTFESLPEQLLDRVRKIEN